MAKQEVIVAEGSFSKLSITLNTDMVNKLAVIEPENNPLAKVEKKLTKLLAEFEKTYFEATKPEVK